MKPFLFCFAGLFFCLAAAVAAPLADAIAARDAIALEALARDAPSAEERQLANGAALALRHRDDAALAALTPLSRPAADKDIRAGACTALFDIHLRQGRYAGAHAALVCAEEASGTPLSGELRQALAYTQVLAGELPMQLLRPASGWLEAYRDSAGLERVPVTINGKGVDAVLDTDSSFPVVSESMAARLGLRVLAKGATILTSTRPDLPMHLGIADELKFGDAVLSHVVFAVLPDAALRFSHGYKMDPVIGLPVFVALGRLELVREGGWERLYYGARPGAAPAEPNLLLSGFDPFALVRCDKAAAPLRLAIDTAASNSMLNATALKDYPALRQGAVRSGATWEGGGGALSDSKALMLGELTLSVAGRPIVLKHVKIQSLAEADRHGLLGQDALKQGWVLDFEKMQFSAGGAQR
jgi:hypothetical protein